MAMFDNEEEIAEVDREKLLGIDLEKLGSLKEKASRITEYLDSYDNIEGPEKENVVKNLDKKIEEIKIIEDDIENAISNLTKIDKIIYGPEETKIIFHKQK